MKTRIQSNHIPENLLAAMDTHYAFLRPLCKQYVKQRTHPYCLIPSDFIHTQLLPMIQTGQAKAKIAYLSAQLNAVCNWRFTQNIYRFHDALYQMLLKQSLIDIPIELLYRLPPSLYVETPANPLIGNGFFSHFDYSENTKECSLRVTFVAHETSILNVPLSSDQDVHSLIKDTFRNTGISTTDKEQAYFENKIRQVLNLLLYLCCENIDYSGRKAPKPYHVSEERKAINVWRIGFDIGAQLLEAETTDRSAGGKIKPHFRSAHYQTYWLGKRGGAKAQATMGKTCVCQYETAAILKLQERGNVSMRDNLALTLREHKIMNCLYRTNGLMTIRELSNAIQVPYSMASTTINKLISTRLLAKEYKEKLVAVRTALPIDEYYQLIGIDCVENIEEFLDLVYVKTNNKSEFLKRVGQWRKEKRAKPSAKIV